MYAIRSYYAQHYRDARILTIYEGTSGIQALDLVGRKILRNEGRAAQALLAEIESCIGELTANPALAELGQRLAQALQQAQRALQWLLHSGAQSATAAGAISYPLLMLMGYLCRITSYNVCYTK